MPTQSDENRQDPDAEEHMPGGGGRGKLILAGLLGSIIGAVAGLLLAPWRGAETRRKLKEAAATASTAAAEKAKAAREKATEALRRRKQAGEEEEAEQG
jgi:gas vesicle protein